MGVLANLISGSSPAYYGGGVQGGGTEAATWRWRFDITDNGTLVDLSGVTANCHIVDRASGLLVVAATCTGNASGRLTIEVDETATAGLAAGARKGRACSWWVTCSDGTDVLQVWGATNSSFTIYSKAA